MATLLSSSRTVRPCAAREVALAGFLFPSPLLAPRSRFAASLGDSGVLSELALREPCGVSQGCKALTEALLGLHGLLPRHGPLQG